MGLQPMPRDLACPRFEVVKLRVPIYEITFGIDSKPLFLWLIYLSCNTAAKSLFGKRNYVDPPHPFAYSGVEWEKVGQSGRLPLGAALGRKGSV